MSFLWLFVANLKSLLRNRMALFWFLLFPVLFILIFGAVFSGGQQPRLDVGLACREGDPLCAGLEQGFAQVKALALHKGTLAGELAALGKGERTLVLEIPDGAATNALRQAETTLPLHYDKGREQTAMMAIAVVRELLGEAEQRLSGRPRLWRVAPKAIQADRLGYIDFLLPGILAMALMQLGFFGAFQIVSLREQKVLKALGATPLPRSHLLAAEVLVRLLVSLLQLAICVAIGVTVFHVRLVGHWAAILGVVTLGALTFTSLGYLLTCRARSVDSGQGLVQLVQFPMMFLSGIFFPLAIMPSFLKPVIVSLPLTYLGDALRQVMVGMPPNYPLGLCLAVLSGWLAVSVLLTIVLWRWE